MEDALHSTRAVDEEGVAPGGGVAVMRAKSVIGDIEGANKNHHQSTIIQIFVQNFDKIGA